MKTVMAALLLLAAGCGASQTVFPGANVVLIGIDTLRADHLGCYGYPRPTSPRLDALAKESVLFTTAVSQSPWTLPAFASIFTGLLPSSHRAGEGKHPNITSLDPSRETMATLLKRAGYRTASFVTNGWVTKEVGMASGFDDATLKMVGVGATNAAIDWVRAHAADRFFLFLHLVEPHQPYEPPPEHAAPFIDRDYQGKFMTRAGGFADPAWSDADRRRVIDLYDGDVHFVDSMVGRVLDALGELGVRGRTLVVVVSDHGEELFDHLLLGHGLTLYDELLLVPMIVSFPDGGPHLRVTHQVRTMDLLPTVLETLELPVPSGLDGVSLLPMIRGEPPHPETERAFAEYLHVDPERKAVRQGDRKLIVDPTAGTAQLFDLRADPHELTDIAAREPDEVAALRVALEHRLLATVEGFHVLVRGGKDAHRVTATLRSAGRFDDVVLYNPEADDRYAVSDDGHTIDLAWAVGARVHRQVGNFDVDDQDGARVRTAGNAPVDVTLRLDDRPLPGNRIVLGTSTDTEPDRDVWRLDPGDRRLLMPFPRPPGPADDGEVHAALLYVARPPPPLANMSAKVRESLRALGYIE